MKLEYFISGGALIISIIFGVITILTSGKANRLQSEVLSLSKKANEFEIKKGAVLMMSSLGRYFVIQLNCWEPNGKIKTYKISIEFYIQELKLLSEEVNNLISNSFYIEILEKYPEINLLWISLRQNILERENSDIMAVNSQTFDKFYDLYYKLKREVNDKKIFKNQFYILIDEAAEHLKKEIPKLKPVGKH